jgi:hypothetical protein
MPRATFRRGAKPEREIAVMGGDVSEVDAGGEAIHLPALISSAQWAGHVRASSEIAGLHRWRRLWPSESSLLTSCERAGA